MVTTATPTAGGGAIMGTKTGNNENQQPLTGQKGNQKKRRNRSKKKKGKGGVGGVGDGGGGGTAAQGSPAAGPGFAPRQKQNQKNQPSPQQRQERPQQQQQQCDHQRHRNKKNPPKTPAQRPTRVFSTASPQPSVPLATTVTVANSAPSTVSDTTELEGAGGQDDHAMINTSNVSDADRYGQVSPSSRAAAGTSTPHKACTSPGGEANKSTRHEKDTGPSKRTTGANKIAPFECSWTTALDSDDKFDDRKSLRRVISPRSYNRGYLY